MSSFNLEYNPRVYTRCKSLHHVLNRPYRGSRPFAVTAPDAPGTLTVHARSGAECAEHLRNALFDLIFDRHRTAAWLENPHCLFCGQKTESRGRNSSNTRVWRCLGPECRRSFVVDRQFKGGINHPSQSKKPAFVRLMLSGLTVREAADRLGLNISTTSNWAEKVQSLHADQLAGLACPCGKILRHRGSCLFRMGRKPRT